MPRPKKAGATEAKTRSRNGCWPCKARKVKCDETRPSCLNCQKQGESCDFSIRLNWDGRGKKKTDAPSGTGQISFTPKSTMSEPVFSNALSPTDSVATPQTMRYESSATTPKSTASAPHFFESQQYGKTMADAFAMQDGIASSARRNSYHQGLSNSTIDTAIDPSLLPTTSRSAHMRSRTQDNTMQSSESLRYDAFERYRWTQSTASEMSSSSRVRNPSFLTGVPSPSDSGQSPGGIVVPNSIGYMVDTPTATPPASHSGPYASPEALSDFQSSGRSAKRTKYNYAERESSGRAGHPPPLFAENQPSGLLKTGTLQDVASSSSPRIQSTSPVQREYGPKSIYSAMSPHSALGMLDTRRLSVGSLLSGPPGMPPNKIARSGETQSPSHLSPRSEQMKFWGIDRGFKDLDIGRNDDANAITGGSPGASREPLEFSFSDTPHEFGFGVQAKDTAFEEGGYYSRPVQVEIPISFEPLPPLLLQNPQNILYFHHFISHTARLLVPHHCSSNPFQNILPRMALEDNDLLCLLLAYSASHRARLLKQPEPATRIALWVRDVFPNLRHALADPKKIVSNANLASAIMLCSLEIISPKVFGISVPWQQHLHTARQIITARGGAISMHHESPTASHFLLRWFGYLDVVGRLMGGHLGLPTAFDTTVTLELAGDKDDDYQIDCLLGFTGRCISILGKVAQLAQRCATERSHMDDAARIRWTPTTEVKEEGLQLLQDLITSRTNTCVQFCPHLHSSEEATYQWDNREIAATNDAYHWAGILHVHRRILGKAISHTDVQNAVREIIGALYKVRKGSSAEACLLCPMFMAGCNSLEEQQRELIMDRVKGVEELGMSQVYKARRLMQRVWETGKPWEDLAVGEFLG